jgi:hypothetical protein
MMAQDRQLLDERRPQVSRRWQDKSRNLDHLDQDFPQNQEHGEKNQRLDDVRHGGFQKYNSEADVKRKL